MKFYLAIVVVLLSAVTHGQHMISPGGIKGPSQWYITDTLGKIWGFRSNISSGNFFAPSESPSASTGSLNFKPALEFKKSNLVKIPFDSKSMNTVSYFTVYQSRDSVAENHIWNITKDNKTSLVLTTSRIADLSANKYINFIDLIPFNPKVNIYVENKEADKSEKAFWNIGNKPLSPRLPLGSFSGLIPEIIAYNRVLSRKERSQVASYLALKYGITLTEPDAIYLNSAGEKIWNGQDYTLYHHNIAGIGRDDSSGVEQKKATSANNPELLTISTNDMLTDRSFLLWGDNGLPLTEAEKTPGVPRMLQKKWLMIANGNAHPFITELILDTKRIDARAPATPVYWLVIDRSGVGDFSLEGTEFIKMNSMDYDGKAHFKGVAWNKTAGGKEVWGCIVAQDLLVTTVIENPTCTNPDRGRLLVKIIGGNPPYHLTVANSNGKLLNSEIYSGGLTEILSAISAGKYKLQVTDARERAYSDSFFVNNNDAPLLVGVKEKYLLPEGGQVRINAAEEMARGLSYQWSGPDNFRSGSPEVVLTKPGTYTLSCSSNGCTARQDVVIYSSSLNELVNKIIVYPNPSNGLFTVKIGLENPEDISASIYDPGGRLISIKRLKGFANYTYTDALSGNGEYQMVFRSSASIAVKKLIIAR